MAADYSQKSNGKATGRNSVYDKRICYVLSSEDKDRYIKGNSIYPCCQEHDIKRERETANIEPGLTLHKKDLRRVRHACPKKARAEKKRRWEKEFQGARIPCKQGNILHVHSPRALRRVLAVRVVISHLLFPPHLSFIVKSYQPFIFNSQILAGMRHQQLLVKVSK